VIQIEDFPLDESNDFPEINQVENNCYHEKSGITP